MEGDQLIFRVRDSNRLRSANPPVTTLEARTVLTGDDVVDFVQIVATIRTGLTHGGIALYVNGQLARTAAAGEQPLMTWADEDGTGLGGYGGEVGGFGSESETAGLRALDGRIAQFRFYGDDLGLEAVIQNFTAIAAHGRDLAWDSGEAVGYVNFAGGEPVGLGQGVGLMEASDGSSRWRTEPSGATLFGIIELDSLLGFPSSAGDHLTVAVQNVAQSAALSGPQQVYEGSPFLLTIGSPFDPGEDTVVRVRDRLGRRQSRPGG